MDLKGIGLQGVGRINLAWVSVPWQVLVDVVMNLQVL
jgi:hypothetical protein